jgi:hypothetical protein
VFKRAFQAEVAEVLAEAEAALTGGLLERHAGKDHQPGWLVVNALAHGDWQRLDALAQGWSHDRSCDAVVAFLASETLSTAGSRAGLDALQRAYLIPLELQLLDAAATGPFSRSAAVTAVRGQLALARARQSHPTSAED